MFFVKREKKAHLNTYFQHVFSNVYEFKSKRQQESERPSVMLCAHFL